MKRLHVLPSDHSKPVVNHSRRVAKLMVLALAIASGPGRSIAADWYVATNGAGYGTSWADATNSLQGAINKAAASETVWVSNGVYDTELTVTPGYALTNRVVITNAITVRSANNNPTNTIIKGAGPLGSNAVRCVYMTNSASLIGFTLTNGYTMANGDGVYDRSGGGILLFVNTVVSNCVISGNAATNGGGVYLYNGGTLNNCTLSGNTATNGGGAFSSNGTMNSCSVIGNRAGAWGGGVNFPGYSANSVVSNCTLTGNTAGTAGGGANMATGATLKNCTISRNTGGGSGGGGVFIIGGSLYNCALLENYSAQGGGIRLNSAGNLYNCTISRNTATSYGGGLSCTAGGGTLENCIVWGNTHATSSNFFVTTNALSIRYSCSGPVSNYASNIGSDPQFVNTNSGNYRLTASSPCVNTGTNGSWTAGSIDLDGRERIRYGRVDMGAYERIHNGTICGVH